MTERKPAVAGQFYPGDPDQLKNLLAELFRRAAKDATEINGHISAVIAPHAGYVFSGLQAAKAYRYLQGRSYRRVCVISPSHREYFPGITLYPGDAYITPLGAVNIDKQACEMLKDCPGIDSRMEGHRTEHALEVQLPFLQYALKDFTLIPLVMGDQSTPQISLAAHCIKKLHQRFGRDILFVASTDLSHFHTAGLAETMDMRLVTMLEHYEDTAIEKALQTGEIEACGGGPVLAVMRGLASPAHRIRTLGYSHSGQILHDDREVVGYTSALILEQEPDSHKETESWN
jgi:MEMO1 family protein